MKINNKKNLFIIIKTGYQFEIEKRNMSFHNFDLILHFRELSTYTTQSTYLFNLIKFVMNLQ